MSDRPPTEDEFVRVLAGMAAELTLGIPKQRRAAAKAGLIDLCGVIVALRRRVERLETRRVPKFVGAWREGDTYEEADCISYGGSMWIAKRKTTSRPSTQDSGWQLCVKHGRDGKSAAR